MWRKIALTSSAQVYSLLTGIVVLTITARWLGPAGRGTIAAITTWVSMFCTFGFLSLGQVAIHRAASNPADDWLGPTLGSLLAVTVTITTTGWILAAGLYAASGGAIFGGIDPVLLAIGFFALPLMVWEQYGGPLLLARDRVLLYNQAQVIGRTAAVALVLLAWWAGTGIFGVLLATLVSQLVVAATGMRELVRQAAGTVRPHWPTTRALLAGGAKLHLNFVGDFLVSSVSVLIINNYLGAEETGHYQIALQLMSVVVVIPSASSMVLLGNVAQLGPRGAWLHQRRVLRTLMVGMLAVAGISAVMAPWAIPFVLGERFVPSVRIFQVLLLASLGITLTKGMSAQWIGRGMFAHLSVMTLIFGAVNLAANLLLVPRYGALGAAWSLVAVYVPVAAAQLWMLRHCDREMRSEPVAPPVAAVVP